MNRNQGKTHKLLDFFAGKGFYVVLILCVAAIGASGYMLFFGGSGDTPDSPLLAATSPQPSPIPPRASPAPANPSPAPAVVPPSSPPPISAPTPPQSDAAADDGPGSTEVAGGLEESDISVAGNLPGTPSVSPDSTAPPAPQPDTRPSFYPPVGGEVLVGYSESADVFFETLREWRFHPGVDIETNAGALVQASADGVVIDIIESAPRNMGATIVIEHSGGYVTVYSNLSSTITATVGKSVKAGDTIGAVGETSIAEQALPPHLHFEILKDGQPVDPMEYLP